MEFSAERGEGLDVADDAFLDSVPEVDGYKVLEPCVLYGRVASGGMGVVYRGRHLNLDIDVAVKCLNAKLAASDENYILRFRREAKIAASISHENLIDVFDIGHRHGVHYLVMEYVTGESARERARRKGGVSVDDAVKIVLGAALGLGEAHRRGIVHRDVKPDNILISKEGVVKVADLGLAKGLEHAESEGMTKPQAFMGTPKYMPPEQWRDVTNVEPSCDVFALGMTLYFLLVGEDAIRANHPMEIMQRICAEPIPSIQDALPDLHPALVRIYDKATKKEAGDRYATALQMAEDLRGFVGSTAVTIADADIGEDKADSTIMLSPPPARTLAKIRLDMDDGESEKDRRSDLDKTRRERSYVRTTPLWAKCLLVLLGLSVLGSGGFLGYKEWSQGDGAEGKAKRETSPVSESTSVPIEIGDNPEQRTVVEAPADQQQPTLAPDIDDGQGDPEETETKEEEPTAPLPPSPTPLTFVVSGPASDSPTLHTNDADLAILIVEGSRAEFDAKIAFEFTPPNAIRGQEESLDVESTDGRFSLSLQGLGGREGTYQIAVNTADEAETIWDGKVVLDQTEPRIEFVGLSQPSDSEPLYIKSTERTRRLIAEDVALAQATYRFDDGPATQATIDEGGEFDIEFVGSPTSLHIEAFDRAGNRHTRTITTIIDSAPPTAVETTQALEADVFGGFEFRTKGSLDVQVHDGVALASIQLLVNSRVEEIEPVDGNQTETLSIDLREGENHIVLTATDRAGHVAKAFEKRMWVLPEQVTRSGDHYLWREPMGSTTPMVLIRGGTYSLSGRDIELSPFLIDRFELSAARYRDFVASAKPRHLTRYHNSQRYSSSDQPLVGVTYEQALEICRWTGKELPTEDEWIVAAGFDPASSSIRTYPWGEDFDTGSLSKVTFPQPSDPQSKDRSPSGTFAMAGSVREWCLSSESSNRAPIRGGTEVSPKFEACLARGDFEVQHATRTWPKNDSDNSIGFRCLYRLKR